jgi:hypothetical protein
VTPEKESNKGTLSDIKNKFNTCRLKKRSIYEVFFNKQSNGDNKSPPIPQKNPQNPKLSPTNPKFYVPLPNEPEKKEISLKNGLPPRNYGSQRVKSASYNPSDSNIKTLFNNINENSASDNKKCDKEFEFAKSDKSKKNSFNPHESMEVTSFLLAKLRLNREKEKEKKIDDYTTNGLPNLKPEPKSNPVLAAERELMIMKQKVSIIEFGRVDKN